MVNTRTLSKDIYRNGGRYCALVLGTCLAVPRVIQPALKELQEGVFSTFDSLFLTSCIITVGKFHLYRIPTSGWFPYQREFFISLIQFVL